MQIYEYEAVRIIWLVVFIAVVCFVPFTASAQSASENVSVNLTVSTTSTSTDDEQDDDQDQPEDDDSRPGQTAELLVDVSRVDVSQEAVEIVWETTVQSKSTVRWQRLDGSGQSFVQASNDYGRTHTTRITGLESGTRYEITLTAEAQNGDTETRREIVQTELPDGPQSVSNLRSNLTGDNGVQLTWNNPEARYDYVRVTRRSDFFSDEPLVGNLIYEGGNQSVVDAEVQGGETYFYSVFVRSEDGRWSAPTLTAIYVPQTGQAPQTDPDPIDDIVSDQPDAPEETKDLLSGLTFADLIFSQGRLLADAENKQVELSAYRSFSVGLDYDKLPAVLKTVVVTITHPDEKDKSFSFLLRADEKKDFYKATVAGLENTGTYRTEVTILDYKNRRVKTLTGDITVVSQPGSQEQKPTTTDPTVGETERSDSRFGGLLDFALLLAGLLLFGILLIIFGRRSEEEEDTEKKRKRAHN